MFVGKTNEATPVTLCVDSAAMALVKILSGQLGAAGILINVIAGHFRKWPHIGLAGLPAGAGAKVIVLATAASTSSKSNPISRT
jgi:hypothetical protein